MLPDKIKLYLDVDKNWIDKGKTANGYECPVALSIVEELTRLGYEPVQNLLVLRTGVRCVLRDDKGDLFRCYGNTSKRMERFIISTDSGETTKPSRFRLTLRSEDRV